MEHTFLRKPRIIVFAYQGDSSLWGYAEGKSWEKPNEKGTIAGEEWGESKFRRLYKIKNLREFKKHVPIAFLRTLGFQTSTIKYAHSISQDIFDRILEEAEGENTLA